MIHFRWNHLLVMAVGLFLFDLRPTQETLLTIPLVFNEQAENRLIRHLDVLKDPGGNLSFERVASWIYAANYAPLPNTNPNDSHIQSWAGFETVFTLAILLITLAMSLRDFHLPRFYVPVLICLAMAASTFSQVGLGDDIDTLALSMYGGYILPGLLMSIALASRTNLLRGFAKYEIPLEQERQAGKPEISPEALVLIDTEQNILLFSQDAESLFGYSETEILGRPIQTLMDAQYGTDLVDRIREFSQIEEGRQKIDQIEGIHALHKNGDSFPVLVSISQLQSGEHGICSLSFRDLSSFRQEELTLFDSGIEFQNLYDWAPFGIVIGNLDGHIIQANPAFLAMMGYDEAELSAMNAWELILPEDRDKSASLAQEVMDGKRSFYEEELRSRHKDGRILWVSVVMSRIPNPKEGTSHTFSLVKDITQRKKAEEELAMKQDILEGLVKQRTRELEESKLRLTILNQASRVVNSAIADPEQIYIAIHQMTAWMMPADDFTVVLVDPASEWYEKVYSANRDGRQPVERHNLQSSLFEWMLENNVSVRGEEFLQADIPGQPRYGLAVLLQGSQKVIGMFCLQNSGGYAYTVEDQKALESFAAHAAIAIENTNLYRRAQETAVNRERQRLSRELHDSVTQLLYSISLLSSGWKKMAQDGRLADPAGSFQELEGISSLALIEMRLLLHQLRPSVLQEAGLVGALKSRLEAVEQRLNIETRFVVEGDLPPLSNSLEEQLYDIVQEALNNALRHAMATAVYINIRHEVGRLILMVQDNGIGFSPEEISAGIGLQSMHERAEVISAELSIHSEVQKGTTVQVAVSI